MPYYVWHGIDLQGRTRKGKSFARTPEGLDSQLLLKDIALLQSKPKKMWLVLHPISLTNKIQFFRSLAELLSAGILLPQALEIIVDQLEHIKLHYVLASLIESVQEGKSLHVALGNFPHEFTPIMITMIQVGQESGSLVLALEYLGEYLEMQQTVNQQLRRAALMPMLTLVFFCFIVLALFLIVVPRFEQIFTSMNKELPRITQIMIDISQFIASTGFLFAVVGVLIIGICLFNYFRSMAGRKNLDRAIMHIPYFKQIVLDKARLHYIQSLSLLIQAGLRPIPALSMAQQAVGNSAIRDSLHTMTSSLESGSSLSAAMIMQQDGFFKNDLIAMVRVGEESGRLGSMLKKASMIYSQRLMCSLFFFTTLFQPLLMIVLGLLITLLIIAVYMPIFNLSNIV